MFIINIKCLYKHKKLYFFNKNKMFNIFIYLIFFNKNKNKI